MGSLLRKDGSYVFESSFYAAKFIEKGRERYLLFSFFYGMDILAIVRRILPIADDMHLGARMVL